MLSVVRFCGGSPGCRCTHGMAAQWSSHQTALRSRKSLSLCEHLISARILTIKSFHALQIYSSLSSNIQSIFFIIHIAQDAAIHPIPVSSMRPDTATARRAHLAAVTITWCATTRYQKVDRPCGKCALGWPRIDSCASCECWRSRYTSEDTPMGELPERARRPGAAPARGQGGRHVGPGRAQNHRERPPLHLRQGHLLAPGAEWRPSVKTSALCAWHCRL